MNKDSIYQIIGYHGEYNNSVKKALKKLLKENHPDHHGNIELFKLINEVKKELETNKVSYKINDKKIKNNFDDIDYEYCKEMIIKLEKKLVTINEKYYKEKNTINNLDIKYNNLYTGVLKNKNIILNIDEKKKELNEIKIVSLIMIILLITVFIIIIVTQNNYLLILLVLMGIILIYEIMNFFKIINKITSHGELEIKGYVNLFDDIKRNQNLKREHEKLLIEIFNEKGKIENNLRFYKNLISKK